MMLAHALAARLHHQATAPQEGSESEPATNPLAQPAQGSDEQQVQGSEEPASGFEQSLSGTQPVGPRGQLPLPGHRSLGTQEPQGAAVPTADRGRDEGDEEGEDAALLAAHRARKGAAQTDEMFAHLAQAEQDFAGARGACQSAFASATCSAEVAARRQGSTLAQQGQAGSRPPAAAGPASARKGIDDLARSKARARLLKAVQAGKHTASLSSAEADAAVERCEAACHSASASRCTCCEPPGRAAHSDCTGHDSGLRRRSVYFSKVAVSATRLSTLPLSEALP